MSGRFAHPVVLRQRLVSAAAMPRIARTAYDSAPALGAALQPRFGVDARGHWLHVPGQPDRLHRADHVPRRIEFPPVEPVARGALIPVMVVVPALADREERGERVVARVVRCDEAARAE